MNHWHTPQPNKAKDELNIFSSLTDYYNMTETLRIRPAKIIYGAIVSLFIVLTIFLFWLAFCTSSWISGLFPVFFATAFAWMASSFIRRPFSLVLNSDGLLVETPFGDSFFYWSGFEKFTIKYMDPFTRQIVFKLKPDVEVPRLYLRLRLADHEVGLFPYFEIGSKELLQTMRRYRYSS